MRIYIEAGGITVHRSNKKDAVPKDSGFLLESFYSIKVKRVRGSFALSLLLQFGLLVTSVLVAMYCVITSLSIEVDSFQLIGGTILICLFVWIVVHVSDFSKTILPETLFILVLTLSEHSVILMDGIVHFANRVIVAINQYYNLKLAIYRVNEKDGTGSLTFLFLLVAFLLSWLFANQIYQKGINYLYLTISLLVIIGPCLVGEIPNTMVFILQAILIIGMFGLTSMQGVGSSYHNQYKKRQFVVTAITICATYMLIAAGIIFIASIVLNEQKYNGLPVKQWKKQVIHTIENADLDSIQKITNLEFPKRNTSVGGLDSGKLNLNNGVIRFNHSTQLKVTMVRPDDGIFLKGFAGANYTGTAWEPVSESKSQEYQDILNKFQEREFSSDNFSILGLAYLAATTDDVQVMPSNIMIEYVKANKKFLYYPYYTWLFENKEDESSYQYHSLKDSEAYMSPQDKNDSYTLRYFFANLPDLGKLKGIGMESSELATKLQGLDDAVIKEADDYHALAEYEEEYREYVYDVYLAVPVDGLYQLKEELRTSKKVLEVDYKLLTSQEKTEKACEFVKDYLWKHAEYSLKPGKTPADQDYIEYFLYTNHKGYCAHYASAATMMLRLLGVPARYAEGYYIKDEMIDNGTIVMNKGAMLQEEDFPTDYIAGEANVYSDGSLSSEVRPMVEVDVDDNAAHAWVEVYVDGFGWYPIEFTEADTEEETALEEKEPILTPEANEPEKEKLPEEEKEPQQEVPSSDEKANPFAPSDQETVTETRVLPLKQILTVLLWGVIVVAVGAAILMYPRYRLNVWRKYFRRYNTSQIYVLWYQRLEKLRDSNRLVEEYHTSLSKEQWEQSEYYGLSYEECRLAREYYLKAVYSKEPLTKEEMLEGKVILQKFYDFLCKHKPKLVQLWYRYHQMLHF